MVSWIRTTKSCGVWSRRTHKGLLTDPNFESVHWPNPSSPAKVFYVIFMTEMHKRKATIIILTILLVIGLVFAYYRTYVKEDYQPPTDFCYTSERGLVCT